MFGDFVLISDYEDDLIEVINKTNIIINLAGENIAGGLWTNKRKTKILESRIRTGELITELCQAVQNKPKMIIQSSAIGYYGYNLINDCTELNKKGNGFLADVCEQWENSTQTVVNLGIKRVIIRTGIVLGNSGGMLPKLILPFKFFMGITLGSGKNFVSWIHIHDYIRAIEFIMQSAEPSLLYNLTSPNPVTMEQIIKELSRYKRHTLIFKVPNFIINLFTGNMGKEMLLSNQKIVPKNLLICNFSFNFNIINLAIKDLIKNESED